ncbi:MAG: FlgD immunoglobulin-like domain containing protein [candidate division KSB1 bacterium]|nr:FlgD immunoglobulin-like domain containing protein [candidate division KSB1 bacterium]
MKFVKKLSVLFLLLIIACIKVSSETAFEINFDTDAQGTDIVAGQFIDDEYEAWGVTISESHSSHRVMAFDSQNPTGGDTDLGTPNEAFGGPGVGAAGATDPGKNDVARGMVIILSTDNNQSVPNDWNAPSGDNARFIFTFSSPVKLADKIYTLDDVEADVYFYDEDNNQIGSSISITVTGENVYYEQDVDVANVKRMEINIDGSGAIPGIFYTRDIDFGDATSDYGLAGHYRPSGSIVKLGDDVEVEDAQEYSLAADGDNYDDGISYERWVDADEDNVIDSNEWVSHTSSTFVVDETYRVTVESYLPANENARLAAWFDFGNNDSFEDNSTERIIDNVLLENNAGSAATVTTTHQFTVPTGANTGGGTTYIRYRLDLGVPGQSPENLTPTGYGEYAGEVQDYTAELSDTPPVAVTLSAFTAEAFQDNVLLEWSAESEINHVGYELLRGSAPDEPFSSISGLISRPKFVQSNTKYYKFTDAGIKPGLHYYILQDVSVDGSTTEHGPIAVNVSVETAIEGNMEIRDFRLYGNYPNPFNPLTVIEYDVPVQEKVVLEIYNSKGQHIKTLVNAIQSPGHYSVTWDAMSENGDSVPSGLYLYRFRAADFHQIGRMVYLK